MLNHREILEKLSEEQKIALVTDLGSAASILAEYDVPNIDGVGLDELNCERDSEIRFPSFASMSNSWNPELLGRVTEEIVTRGGAGKYNFIRTPSAQVRSSAYADGMTEDPYLNSRLANACIDTIENSGAGACLTECSVRKIDEEYFGAAPEASLLKNVLLRPFERVVARKNCTAARVSFPRMRGDWRYVNKRFAFEDSEMQSGDVTVIASNPGERIFRAALAKPNVVFSGVNAAVVRSALTNYRRMNDDVKRGTVSVEELEKAIDAGTALSDELLDAAVLKVIELAMRLKRERTVKPFDASTVPALQRYVQFAAQESTVLLKDAKGVLPIVKGSSVCIVGELAKSLYGFESAISDVLMANGIKFAGYADGYRITSERDDEALAEAKAIAAQADHCIVFAGLGQQREQALAESRSVALPADQSALIAELAKLGKKITVVVTGEFLPDMSFDKWADVVMFAPSSGSRTATALFSIIIGIIAPSGRLAASAYYGTDELFSRRKTNIATGRIKAGEFVGYREYVTSGIAPAYPFGHGLSYTSFEYSDLNIVGENVQVTVKNTGLRPGCEVAQLYIGKADSAIVRPKMELAGFAKVMINPGTAMQIVFPISSALLSVIDPSDGKRKTERGKYQVYVGASAGDIRLTGEVYMGGVEFEKSDALLSDYIADISNITGGNYKLRGASSVKDKSARVGEKFSYEQLFLDEFIQDEVSYDAEEDEEYADSDEVVKFLDESVTVKTTADGLMAFAASKGFGMDASTARDTVAAFAASRLVLAKCDKQTFDDYAAVLCDYFGCERQCDDAHAYEDGAGLFVAPDGSETSIARAAEFATLRRERVTIALADGVDPKRFADYFAPLIRYVTAPDTMTVGVGRGEARKTVHITPNVWFVMRVDDAETDGLFPDYLADIAAVVMPELTRGKRPSGVRHGASNYYQLIGACEKAERKYELDEAYWKKIDKLEKYVNARSPFEIGNKICVQIERYAAVQLACGADQSAACDSAAAAKLMPVCCSLLHGKLTREDGDFATTLDGIFGDDCAARCKLAAKRSGLTRK